MQANKMANHGHSYRHHVLHLVQAQKWSFTLEKTPDFELDLV